MADERLTVPVEIVPGTDKDKFENNLATKYADAEVKVKVSPEIDTKAKSPQTLESELNEKYKNIKLNISIAEENSKTIEIFATNLAKAVASRLKAQLEGTPINIKAEKDDGSSGGVTKPLTRSEMEAKLSQLLYRFGALNATTKGYYEPLNQVEREAYGLLQDVVKNLRGGQFDYLGKTDEQIRIMHDNVKNINIEMARVKPFATAMTSQNRQLSEKSNLARLGSVYLENNAGILKNQDLYGRWNAFITKTGLNGYTAAELKKEYSELREETQALGLETVSLGQKLKKLFNEHMKTAMVMALINAIRQFAIDAVQQIIKIDDAMTELKKVTDETAQSYEKFLDRAADKAQKLGTTIADTVTATADFARLGYDMTEAEDLATAALVYKNVGDGIDDISVASQSLVSTMAAFGIEAEKAMLIVDKFNKIGNEMPISSVGIGEALTRSAAGLAETNNTLDESIALIVAANSVIQNPEVVGEWQCQR